jgi:hypothetical protein
VDDEGRLGVLWAYATATSCAQGESLPFRIGDSRAVPRGWVTVEDAVSGQELVGAPVHGPDWTLDVPPEWRSSLYRAVFRPGEGPDAEVWFVVRPAPSAKRAAVLLSVPFTTWQAYNRSGVPGQGLYWAEDPLRAHRVSFDRPGGGPPPERWEEGLMQWLRESGTDVDYCSNLDLHLRPDLLSGYRLLVVNGHDEYWTRQMRDAVEGFTRRGGNLAIFGANTSWWQMRLEDDGRTMVCYRDATVDPLAENEPELTTVEWSSSPVNRPENAMTGLSFRLGAGCWGPEMSRMYEEAYTVRFADHWVFEGTGLTDGDKFAQGALGYETDAADVEEVDGVPLATGRDGTPPSFTVLATADLRHWAEYGQGGAATMGVFDVGRGTVFNAGTVNWGAALADPVVARVTRTVVDRLCAPPPADEWTVIGPRDRVLALAVWGSRLFALLEDGVLAVRESRGQNLPWRRIGPGSDLVALAAPREAVVGGPHCLYAASSGGALLRRDATVGPARWTEVDRCPDRTRSLAACDARLFALDAAGVLWTAAQGAPDGAHRTWQRLSDAAPLRRVGPPRGVTSMNGRLFALGAEDTVLSRETTATGVWTPAGAADGVEVLAAHAGRLVGAGGGRPLRWRPVTRR